MALLDGGSICLDLLDVDENPISLKLDREINTKTYDRVYYMERLVPLEQTELLLHEIVECSRGYDSFSRFEENTLNDFLSALKI